MSWNPEVEWEVGKVEGFWLLVCVTKEKRIYSCVLRRTVHPAFLTKRRSSYTSSGLWDPLRPLITWWRFCGWHDLRGERGHPVSLILIKGASQLSVVTQFTVPIIFLPDPPVPGGMKWCICALVLSLSCTCNSLPTEAVRNWTYVSRTHIHAKAHKKRSLITIFDFFHLRGTVQQSRKNCTSAKLLYFSILCKWNRNWGLRDLPVS